MNMTDDTKRTETTDLPPVVTSTEAEHAELRNEIAALLGVPAGSLDPARHTPTH